MVAGHTDIASALIALDRPEDAHREIDATPREPRPAWRAIYHALVEIDQRHPEAAVKLIEASALGREGRPAVLPPLFAAAGRLEEALEELNAGGTLPTCDARAFKAALLHDTGDHGGALRLAAPILAAAAADADGESVRCAVAAAAGLGDAPKAAELLTRMAGSEELLRAWARQLLLERGAIRLRGRLYPWNRIVAQPAMTAARQAIDEAYARERDAARAALNGLP